MGIQGSKQLVHSHIWVKRINSFVVQRESLQGSYCVSTPLIAWLQAVNKYSHQQYTLANRLLTIPRTADSSSLVGSGLVYGFSSAMILLSWAVCYQYVSN